METPTGYTTSGWQRRDAPLGTLVYRAGLLTAEQVEEALKESVERGRRLGQVLVEKGLVEESDIARLLAEQRGLQYISVRNRPVDPEAVRLLPAEFAWTNHAIPVWFDAGEPVVAIEDPTDDVTMLKIAETIGRSHRVVVATRSEVLRLLSEWHPSHGDSSSPPLPSFTAPDPAMATNGSVAHGGESTNGAPSAPLPTLDLATPEQPAAALPPQAPAAPPAYDAPEPFVSTEQIVSPDFTAPTPSQPVTTPLVSSEPVAQPEPVAPAGPAAPAEPVSGPAPLGTVSIPDIEPAAPAPVSPPQADQALNGAASRLVARLMDGEQFELGAFSSADEAREHARGLIASLQGDPQDWPFVRGRFIRPESIVSLDVLES